MINNSTYKIEKIKNSEIIPFLNLDPIYNAYTIYVCKTKPEDMSLAVVSKFTNNVEAVLITGKEKPTIYMVYGYWLAAANYESAEIIINEIKNNNDFCINYPIWAEDIIAKYFPKAVFTYDNIYVYNKKHLSNLCSEDNKAQKLTAELYKSINIPSGLKSLFSIDDLIPQSKFFGAVEDNNLCAIGERLLDTGSVAGISQLITLEECRKKGYAVSIIRGLTKEIISENKIPIYLLSEENIASKKSCEKSGYVLHSRIGFAEIES